MPVGQTAGTAAQFRASQVAERSTVSRSRAFAADLVRQRRTSEPERVHRVVGSNSDFADQDQIADGRRIGEYNPH
jgi:hypothetical protein